MARWLVIVVHLTAAGCSSPGWTVSPRRHAPVGGLTEAGKAAGVAELREVAGDRCDLLAGVAGLALGAAEGKGQEYQARGQAIAELCRMAGADKSLIPQWRQAGRERAAMAGRPPFSQPR